MARNTAIAVDVDEVLAQFVPQLIAFHNSRYATNHTIKDFHSYEFWRVWEIPREECDVRVREFFDSEHFAVMPTIPHSIEVLMELKRHHPHYQFYAVTSRQSFLEEVTRKWLHTHFPGVFTDVLLGNHYGTGTKRSKPEMCASVNAKVLIDDSLLYATQCADAGLRVLLFDLEHSYPWNKTAGPLHPNIIRVDSWHTVHKLLKQGEHQIKLEWSRWRCCRAAQRIY